MDSISNAFEAYQFMSEKNILMAYTGRFDHEVTTSLLRNIKNKLNVLMAVTGLEKKVYNILVESIENVSKHGFSGTDGQNIAILLLSKSDTKYTIITGNLVLNSDMPLLKERLEKVSALSVEDLKLLYRKQILSKGSGDNNAGLGILDIAIKSGNKIQYDFKPMDDLTSFYLLQTEININ